MRNGDTMSWPGFKVETWPLTKITKNPRNVRTHPDEQVEQLVASMKEFGWTIPLLIDEHGMLIAGEGRLIAAQRLGMTTAPVIVARGWSENQKRAYMLADNKIQEGASWDMGRLVGELEGLRDGGFDLHFTGFGGEEIEKLLGPSHRRSNVKAIDVSAVGDMFWISIQGPLEKQAAILQHVKDLMGTESDITVDLGTVARD